MSQPPPLPPSPSVNAIDGLEGTRFVAGGEIEKPEESATPSGSFISDAMPQPQFPYLTPHPKKGAGRRKKDPLTPKQRATAERNLHILSNNFSPLPFSPAKTLNFSAHEALFRALGLWDFAHLELDREVRSDLLVHLIAYYDPSNRRSYVYGARISVSRSDLARALSLPIKKEKANAFECMDEDISVLLEFISNYMPYGDDMCILPPEIMQATQLVKDKEPLKVDWSTLMWVLVEKQLLEASKFGVCHCASHLQCLIKHQQPNLFHKKEMPVLESVVESQEDEVSVVEAVLSMANDDTNVAEDNDDYDDVAAVKVRSLEDLGNVIPEKDTEELGLTLGVEENLMDSFEEDKVGEDNEWPEEGDNEGFEHCFPRCNSREAVDIDFENLTKHEQGSQAMGYADDLSAKLSNLGRMSSSDLLQAMENTSHIRIPYDEQLNSFSAASGEFLRMGAESSKDILGHGPNGSLYSVNNGKRQAGAMSAAEEDHFEHNLQKKMRSAETWGNMPLSFDHCIECMQTGLERFKLLYAEKDQKMANVQMQMPYLNQMLHEKDQSIRSMRLNIEEQQHWKMVLHHYEHELSLMTQMLLGYKKALKETRCSFSEYRKKCSEDVEALYKDVPGTNGLVLSTREFEKHQLEKDGEERQKLLCTFGNLEDVLMKFSIYEERIKMYNIRLVDLAGEVKKLKERVVKSNFSRI
ncbi:uncharacterized protein LOC110029295 [Phalaenopsis equestris]|uniref:uncharacterized protein LOC110029295 n=1 Tax=Phalaenopsis equestris TaxID=78828 RepID=UPI0009E52442|nr:uncharacterized protein LOC110029295 [Phalaenopsis equestris]